MDSGNIRFIATDGHRLVIEDSSVGGQSVVLDKVKTFQLSLLAFQTLGASKNAWRITHIDSANDKSKGKVFFEDSRRTVIAFLKDTIFPDYRKVTDNAGCDNELHDQDHGRPLTG